MNHDTPVSPRPLNHLTDVRPRVLTARALREHGVSAATTNERCRPDGPWQMLLPGVYLLHPGPPTSEDRLQAALLYGRRRPVPAQAGPGGRVPAQSPDSPPGAVMITGMAALALHGFSSTPPLSALEQIDVLLPRTRRLRSTGCAHIVRAHALPEPEQITGLPVAPVSRALADAAEQLDDAVTVRRMLTEAVRGGHCEAHLVVAELSRARLLSRPHLAHAVEGLLCEGRARAEGRLYHLVRTENLPSPCWNVDLRLPGGPDLGPVDAYWPEQAVAVEIDTRTLSGDEEALWPEYARKREALERLGITVVHLTPEKLRASPEQQAAVVRTALMAAEEGEPAAYTEVLPR